MRHAAVTYRFEIGITRGREWARYGDVEAPNLNCLALRLVAASEPDGPWEAAWAGKPPSLLGQSLHGLAANNPHARQVPLLAQILDARAKRRGEALAASNPSVATGLSQAAKVRQAAKKNVQSGLLP